MDHPEPVMLLAIGPKTKADQDKFGQALQELMAEDPSFRVNIDARTGQTILRGMSERHLEAIRYEPLRGGADTDEDRTAPVPVPRSPAPKGKSSGVALPASEDEGSFR